jgi:CheY-like chemotaxis protein
LPEVSPAVVAAARKDTPSPTRALRVLVVEDSEPIAVMLVTLRERWGHDVRLATDGPAALTLARTYEPDVVLLDIGLPGMSGYEVAQKLRAEAPIQKLVIVAMTGYDEDDHRRLTLEAGCDHHLVKPIDPNTVKALLKNVMTW